MADGITDGGSWNENQQTKYLEAVLKQLKEHNVWDRVTALSKSSQTDNLTDKQKNKYNNIDKCITTTMGSVKQKLPPKRSTHDIYIICYC